MIKEDGVASVRFDGVASAAAVKDEANGADGVIQGLVNKVWNEIQALTYGEEAEKPDNENLKVEVFLKFDKRNGTAIDQQEIKDVAESVSDEGDGFEIVTLSGFKIKPEDVLLNKRVSFTKYGKSIAFNDALDQMTTYYHELTAPAKV